MITTEDASNIIRWKCGCCGMIIRRSMDWSNGIGIDRRTSLHICRVCEQRDIGMRMMTINAIHTVH